MGHFYIDAETLLSEEEAPADIRDFVHKYVGAVNAQIAMHSMMHDEEDVSVKTFLQTKSAIATLVEEAYQAIGKLEDPLAITMSTMEWLGLSVSVASAKMVNMDDLLSDGDTQQATFQGYLQMLEAHSCILNIGTYLATRWIHENRSCPYCGEDYSEHEPINSPLDLDIDFMGYRKGKDDAG